MQTALGSVLERIEKAKAYSSFNEEIRLIAISKMVESEQIKALYDEGQVSFGENRVQSLKQKCLELSSYKIDWHFVGRLQTNKINQLLLLRPTLIHSCDSLSLALEIDKRVSSFKPDILLQINSAKEETKAGVEPRFAQEIYEKIKEQCKNINLCGVMSIGAHTDDKKIVQSSFETTRDIYDKLKPLGAKYCSMGMSSDFELSIKCGSNMLRVGSSLFTPKSSH